jgi:hypothetical protein
MESHIAHKLTVRYLKRREAAAGAKAVPNPGRTRKTAAPKKKVLPAQSSGPQGPCPLCGGVGRLLRTQVLDADGGRVDWICSRCRG